MIRKLDQTGFELSISEGDDGTLQAAYIKLSAEKVARTREVIADSLLADYDDNGEIIGMEILAPVKLSDLLPLVDPGIRPGFSRFVERRVPHELVLA